MHIILLEIERKLSETSKSLKILRRWLSAKFSLPFMSLLTALVVKNCYIWTLICFIFLKPRRKKTWKTFNTKFRPQWKDWKGSYQVTQVLALFCILIPLILDWKCVTDIRVKKIDKEIMFEGIWAELVAKNSFQRNHLYNIWD